MSILLQSSQEFNVFIIIVTTGFCFFKCIGLELTVFFEQGWKTKISNNSPYSLYTIVRKHLFSENSHIVLPGVLLLLICFLSVNSLFI